jgi:hypothetical protein
MNEYRQLSFICLSKGSTDFWYQDNAAPHMDAVHLKIREWEWFFVGSIYIS